MSIRSPPLPPHLFPLSPFAHRLALEPEYQYPSGLAALSALWSLAAGPLLFSKERNRLPQSYRVTGGPDGQAGIDYPTKTGPKRAEPGEVVDDVPARSVAWLVDLGYLEPVATSTRALAPSPSKEGE